MITIDAPRIEGKWYFVKSKHAKCQRGLTINQCKKYAKLMKTLSFTSFAELVSAQNGLWSQCDLNSTTAENWQEAGQITCDGPVFMKQFY